MTLEQTSKEISMKYLQASFEIGVDGLMTAPEFINYSSMKWISFEDYKLTIASEQEKSKKEKEEIIEKLTDIWCNSEDCRELSDRIREFIEELKQRLKL